MKNFGIKYLLVLLLLCIAAGCAKEVRPTGGPKDTTPPSILASSPKDKSLNFEGNEIRLEFDEFVQLKDVEKELFISPFMANKPKVVLKRKAVVLTFEEPLKDNITYTVDFGRSIVDNNEGNPATGLKFVFSTGDQIDSLFVMGNLIEASTGAAKEDVYVSLYHHDSEADSLLYKRTPDYLARTDKAGNFRIEHIKSGNYLLYGLEDLNNNYLFDDNAESIAFLDSLLVVNDSTANHNLQLRLFNEGKEKPKQLSKKHEEYGRCEVIYSKPLIDPEVLVLDSLFESDNHIFKYSTENDTISLWYKEIHPPKITLVVKAQDLEADTVKFKKTISPELGKGLKLKVQNSQKGAAVHSLPYKTPLILTANHPLESVNPEKFELYKDSIKLNASVELEELHTSTCSVSYPWEADSVYNVIVYPGGITDYFGKENDTLKFSLKSRSLESYGNLILLLSGRPDTSSLFYQLHNSKGHMIEKAAITDTTLQFNYLEPGSYELRVCKDENQNLQWDSGDLLLKSQPEGILFFKGISVKPNWDSEYEIKVE